MNLAKRIKTAQRNFVSVTLAIIFIACGCNWRPVGLDVDVGVHQAANAIPNPLAVPLLPRDVVMEQVSDELDNYFKIKREERVRLSNNILTEGWIETHPRIGSTLLEPWYSDSSAGFEKLQSTLQTIRRFAKVRIIPREDVYQIDLKVYKELEDLPKPQHATASGTVIRYDNSVDIDRNEIIDYQRTRGWIPLGRDIILEQRILANLKERLDLACQEHPIGLYAQ